MRSGAALQPESNSSIFNLNNCVFAFLRFCLLATTPYLGNSWDWKWLLVEMVARFITHSVTFRTLQITLFYLSGYFVLSPWLSLSVYLSIFLFVSDYLFVYLFAYICDLFSCQFVHFLVSLSTFLFPISRFLYLKYHFMSLFSLTLTQT